MISLWGVRPTRSFPNCFRPFRSFPFCIISTRPPLITSMYLHFRISRHFHTMQFPLRSSIPLRALHLTFPPLFLATPLRSARKVDESLKICSSGDGHSEDWMYAHSFTIFFPVPNILNKVNHKNSNSQRTFSEVFSYV